MCTYGGHPHPRSYWAPSPWFHSSANPPAPAEAAAAVARHPPALQQSGRPARRPRRDPPACAVELPGKNNIGDDQQISK